MTKRSRIILPNYKVEVRIHNLVLHSLPKIELSLFASLCTTKSFTFLVSHLSSISCIIFISISLHQCPNAYLHRYLHYRKRTAQSALAPTYQIANNTTMPTPTAQVHDRFAKIEIHTAKCDVCDQRNMANIYRCLTCGQQTCTPCVNRKAGTDGIHVLKYVVSPVISAKKRKKLLQQNGDKANEAKKRKSRILRKDSDDDEPIESDDETQVDLGAGTPRSYASSRHERSAGKAIPNSRNAQANVSSYELQFPLEEKPQARGSYNYPQTPPSEKHTQNKVHPKSTITPL